MTDHTTPSATGIDLDDLEAKALRGTYITRAESLQLIAVARRAETTNAARDVLAERRRQVEAEGWTRANDDGYTDHSLAKAAAAYAMAAATEHAERAVLDDFGNKGLTFYLKHMWPTSWEPAWFKPKSRRADLVKAGALILAEIERIDHAASSEQKGGS